MLYKAIIEDRAHKIWDHRNMTIFYVEIKYYWIIYRYKISVLYSVTLQREDFFYLKNKIFFLLERDNQVD